MCCVCGNRADSAHTCSSWEEEEVLPLVLPCARAELHHCGRVSRGGYLNCDDQKAQWHDVGFDLWFTSCLIVGRRSQVSGHKLLLENFWKGNSAEDSNEYTYYHMAIIWRLTIVVLIPSFTQHLSKKLSSEATSRFWKKLMSQEFIYYFYFFGPASPFIRVDTVAAQGHMI